MVLRACGLARGPLVLTHCCSVARVAKRTMRSVSLALLAVGAGAFAPQPTVRRSTALAVHRPCAPAWWTSYFKPVRELRHSPGAAAPLSR